MVRWEEYQETGETRDVNRLRSLIKSDNPRAAQRAAKRIVEGVNMLRDNPEAGQVCQ